MKSIISLLFLMVLSGCLNECRSSILDYFQSSPSEVRPSTSMSAQAYKGRKSIKTPFVMDDDQLQPLYDEDLGKEKTAKEFSTKDAPSCARNKVYCKKDSEYDDIVREIFNKALDKDHMNLQDLGIMSKMFIDPIIPPSTRYHDNFLEDPVCSARDEIIFPQRGQTKAKDWVFILNQDNFEQGIKIATCLNLTSIARFSYRKAGELKCSARSEDSSESFCRQNYVYRNVMAMDKSGTKVIKEEVLFPSCCVCKTRKIMGRIRNYNFHASNSINKDESYRQYGSSNLRKGWN